MSRPLRIEYPGAMYHVTSRGNEKGDIYSGKGDYLKFFEYLEKAFKKFKVITHAFCLMTNHYHFLVETQKANLNRFLHYINSCYSTYYNRTQKRVGHLFQGRYKAILIEEGEYLRRLSRYIHLNPVRAKMVEKPEDYPWSSYRYFIKEERPPVFLDIDRTLTDFKDRDAYKRFVEEGLARKVDNPLKEAFPGNILGGEEFVEEIKEKYLKDIPKDSSLAGLSKLNRVEISTERIVEIIEVEKGLQDRKGIRQKYIFSRSIQKALLRKFIRRLSVKKYRCRALVK